jgi:cytoskeleton protein RodZ
VALSQAFTPGFGATLAAARESRGLTVAQVAERLKLSARQIEAIEAEDWASLPDPVFVRGFVRNYAKLVGVAPDDLMPAVNGVAAVTQTITAPSAGVRLGGSPVARWLLLPLILAVVFVSVVVGLYTWLRQGEDALLPAETALPAGDAAAVSPVAEGGQEAGAAAPPPSPTAGTKPPLPAAAAPAPQAPPQPVAGGALPPAPPPARVPTETPPAAPAPRAATAPGGSQSDPAQAPAQGQVSMRFAPAEDSWIQVVDSKGMRFSKLVRGGTIEVVSGTPPFRLVVGNAVTVSLVYNGHVIDLKPYIGEKVARLTLE